MKTVIAVIGITLMLASIAFAAPAEQILRVEGALKKAAAGRTGEYAKELLEAAQVSLSDAQAAVKAGREKEVDQKIELAEQQLAAADVKSAEKETVEKVALQRAELKKQEAMLEKFRQGEDK